MPINRYRQVSAIFLESESARISRFLGWPHFIMWNLIPAENSTNLWWRPFFCIPSAFGHNFHLSRLLLRKRYMAKGDITKSRSGCPCKIPLRVPLFLATPQACCFDSLRIKRHYDVYYRHRAYVIDFGHLMLILSTATSWVTAPSFLRRKKKCLIVKPLVCCNRGTNIQKIN